MDKQPDNDKSEKISDELLDEYLDGGTPVSQAYREMGQPEPSPSIDRAILEQAREAAKSRPLWFAGLDLGSAAFWSRWIKPMTTLVTMGICLAVVLEIMDYTALTPLELQEQELSVSLSKQATLDEDRPSVSGPQQAPQTQADVAELAAAPQPQMAAESKARASLPAPASARERSSPEEVMVSSSMRAEILQDVPMSVSAYSADESDAPEDALEIDTAAEQESMAAARKAIQVIKDPPSPRAIEAWENGARPAANVWQAGIEALLDSEAAEAADRELQRMAMVYPDAAAEFRTDRQVQLDTKRSATSDVILDEIAVMERKDESLDGAQDLADAWVWAQGIKWLRASGAAEEAAAEQEKFSQVYPDFSD